MGIGYEREWADKPAGLRTHMLVSLAACSFTIVALEMVATLETEMEASTRLTVNPDPTRVIEAVITGIAFLGAGTIIQARRRVTGITTGASIWLAGAVGLACGGGFYIIAGLTVLLTLATLVCIRRLERVLMGTKTKRSAPEDT
jgi:putative Mg2+ transporter-C (MgtC) family protein